MSLIHKEGYFTLIISAIVLFVANGLTYTFVPPIILFSTFVFLALWLFLVSFFRNPKRTIDQYADDIVYCPADGKIVVIENTNESEVLKDERIQVSIFMSPLNVHVNRNPISGKVTFFKYHPGAFYKAWNPKASTENERTTVMIENPKGKVLFRQIAGALARRIVWYVSQGDEVKQGEDMGFIKLGSRVDVFLPKDAKLEVEMGQMVSGNKTVLARLV
ncbi:phosphatidylserine decarboxylase family protein [Saprospiraceae bacterium]|nr:phosphatidylserine decarboxylase family protein [Saprospiraceae bacterium]MDA9866234.1 phosphatidylserine decarboxylase family protein [Saprospiraceae bacterium]MDC1305361.1 phosphatidylserine decarboxylase family protein [Saprospiraceae bacterium]